MKEEKKKKVIFHREVVVMPDAEHKEFLKLVKSEKKAKSRVVREAIKEKINKLSC